MFSFKNPHKTYSMVEALDEPAYVFSLQGAPIGHNQEAEDLMRSNRLPFTRVPSLPEFTEIIDGLLPPTGVPEFFLGGALYEYDCRAFPEGTLVRFRPLKERDHILRLSASLDNMPWGILTLDTSGDVPMVVYANRGACHYMDAISLSPIGQNGRDVLRVFGIKDDLSSHIMGPVVSYYDFEKIGKEASTWYRLHFIPYKQGRQYCLIVLEDRTEGKTREGQYFQSQRLEALGQLAGGVAHDFNNILSIIDGYARIGRKSALEIPETQNCLDRITQAVERASAITSQLLTFGSHKIVKGEVSDLGKIIREQEPLLRPVLDATINLAIKVEEGLFIDSAQDAICQILLNLCINSRDAMPDGGDLIVEAGRRGEGKVFLRVIDTGQGMSPEIKAKMFDPFFTTKDQGKGTGLGLSVVYGLVNDMHGEIDVLTQQGAGTSITVWLHAAQPEPTVKEEAQEVPPVRLDGYMALVVEDEPDLLKILKLMLDDLGLHVLTASNGNEALAIQGAYKGEIDFLITDVVMPDLNGVKLSALFRSVRPKAKVVFMSGYPANGQMARVPLPFNAILLPKPVKIGDLANILLRMANEQKDDLEAFKSLTGHWRSV